MVSPSALPSAMSRSSRRMIFPERVFGRSAAKIMSSGSAIAPIFLHDVVLELVDQCRRCACTPSLTRDERGDRLALDLVAASDDRGLGDLRVIDERALDFHRADAVARDVQHVVHAAEQPEEAVGVDASRRRR